MGKENRLLILWIIFGFVFVAAVDSILYFTVHLIYFAASEFGSSYNFLTYFIPILTLILYGLTTLLFIQNLKYKSETDGIYLKQFPTKNFTILALLAILLNPITNKLSGLYGEYITSTIEATFADYLNFYGWMNFGFGLARWLIVISLVIFYNKKIKPAELKTKHNSI